MTDWMRTHGALWRAFVISLIALGLLGGCMAIRNLIGRSTGGPAPTPAATFTVGAPTPLPSAPSTTPAAGFTPTVPGVPGSALATAPVPSATLDPAPTAALTSRAAPTVTVPQTMVDNFEGRSQADPWIFSTAGGAAGSLSLGEGHNGGTGLRLAYDFMQGGDRVSAQLAFPSPVTGAGLAFWVKSPPGILLALQAVDESGQSLSYVLRRPLRAVDPNAWYQQVVEMDASASHSGGANDGQVHGGIQRVAIQATNALSTGLKGEVLLDDVALLGSLVFALDSQGATPVPATADYGDLSSRLGIEIHSLNDIRALDAARSAGFTWVRTDLFWKDVERRRGVYDFSRFEAFMKVLTARGMKALFILDYGNHLYQGTDQTPPTTPEAIQAFGQYVTAAAQKFAPYGVRYEIWNEPNWDSFWPPSPWPDQYTVVAKEAIARIKAVDPNAVVAAGALSKFDYGYLQSIIARGAANDAHAISVHPYVNTPEDVSDNLFYMRSLVDSMLPQARLPIWNTEWGYSSADYGDGHSSQARLQQAVMVTRELLVSWAEGLPITVYYDLLDDGTDPRNKEENFGLLDDKGAEKPAIQAVRTLVANAQGRKLTGFIDTIPTSLHALMLTGANDSVVVLWSDTAGAKVHVVVPPGATVTDMLGAPLTLAPDEEAGGQDLTVRESSGPVYVHIPGH